MAREALYRAAVGEAAAHVAKGAAEMVGLKPKTATQESKRRAARADRLENSGSAGIDEQEHES